MIQQALIVVVIVLLGTVQSSPEIPETDSQEYCEGYGMKFKKGESVSVPGECYEITCENPVDNTVGGVMCPSFAPTPGCHQTDRDYSLAYPDCCPKIVCPKT